MIRIGIVGCGRILAAHLAGFRQMRGAGDTDFLIAGLCARSPQDAVGYVERGSGTPQRPACSAIAGDPLAIGEEYLSDFQDPSAVKIYSDYAAMIRDSTIDAVLDLTPHGLHHRVAAETFAVGKHLLSQKPLAATVRAGRRMCEQADRAGVTFGTFECFRFLPETRALEWLFRTGRGGLPRMILLGYVGAWWAPDLIVADTPWRHQKSEAGGITLDLGVHFFDQMRQVAGRPVTITGEATCLEKRRFQRKPDGTVVKEIDADADDTVMASIQFESGAVASLVASWSGALRATTMGTGSVYYGQKARVDGKRVQTDDGLDEELVALYRREADPAEIERVFPRGLEDWFALGQTDWLEAIRAGRSPEMSGEEGLIDLAASFAILESSHARRQVSFDEVFSGKLADFQRPLDEALGLL